MKTSFALLLFIPFVLAACGQGGSSQVPVAELPDPLIYALSGDELPDVGLTWQQTYNFTDTQAGYKWSYTAYQAYQPGNLGIELESAFAVNNDVVLYEVDVSREDLPQPPQALGDIQGIDWKTAPQPRRLGDKSAAWKTTLGEMLTPVWWLEFYQDHAYVRISLFGFPDQIALSIIYGMGDIVLERLPKSVDQLRADAATVVPTAWSPLAPSTPGSTQSPELLATSTPVPEATPASGLIPLSYTAPPGETGMVSYLDDTGSQLTDGTRGLDDILADQGSGTAYEWVGWTDATDPVTLTFTFEGQPSIERVEIGFNHRDGLGIFPPFLVTINAQRFELPVDAVPNNQRKDFSFSGPFKGPVVEIVLQHQGRGWILVDEVSFIPED